MNESNAESCITIDDDNEEAQTHSTSEFLVSQHDPQCAGTVVSNSDSNSLRFATLECFVKFIVCCYIGLYIINTVLLIH